MSLDQHAATELELFIDNDEPLYRQQLTPIHKNLATKMIKGVYQRAGASKLFMYLMDAGAKKYAQQFSSPGDWNKIFSVETRKKCAEDYAKQFEIDFKNGEYDRLLPKKYQK